MPRWSAVKERDGSCKSTDSNPRSGCDAKAEACQEGDEEEEEALESSLPPPLDPAPELPPALLAARRRHVARVDRDLQRYDESRVYPRPEDKEYGSRHGYELHLRSDAVCAVRRTLKREVAKRTIPAPVRPHVIILALIPVHIVQEGRLQKLRHTLRTIQQQEALPVDCELVLAVSWYAVPALAREVQELLAELVQLRKGPKDLPCAVVCSGSHLERSIQTWCRQSWSWGRGQQRGRSQQRGRIQLRSVLVDEARSPGYSLGTTQESEEPRALTVVVQQLERKSQFQHLHAALRAAEATLRDRWAFLPSEASEANKKSIWVMFGDDDDLWHPRRVATYVHAIQRHPLLVGVGVFVTLARANVERDELASGEFLPTTAAHVDDFLQNGRATLNCEEKDSSAWLEERRDAGGEVAALLLPDGLDLEYFDFCPRLRIFNEFFETVSPSLLAHRFCDLRLSEFLMRYNAMGRELGMEVCFVESETWLYFYAIKGAKDTEWSSAIEDDHAATATRAGIGEGAHVSTQVPEESCDLELAESKLRDFSRHDDTMTMAKLSRYFAHFRFNMEMRLVRDHRRKVDQRDFDDLLVQSCNMSFLGYTDRIIAEGNVHGEKLMVEVCRRYGQHLAERLEVGVLWHCPGELLVGPKRKHTGGSTGGSSGGEEETARSPVKDFLLEDSDEAEFAQVSSKVLAKWAKHDAANIVIRNFVLENEWGEADALGFEDVFRLLDGAGVSKENVANLSKTCSTTGDDAQSVAVGTLRKLAPRGRESDVLDFPAVHRLLAALGFSPAQFIDRMQPDERHEEKNEALTKWPLLSGYRVLREIGTGLAGSVFLCEHTSSRQRRALKWPVQSREVTVMKKIRKQAGRSAGLPKILAVGEHQDAFYFVTELLGSKLARIFECIQNKPLESRWDVVRLVGRMVLRRLEALHNCGYVHCDVAPHNLLLGRCEDGLCLYLIDFGCARRFPGGGRVSAECGSLEYSSVRSADGGERRPEEDLEALGWAMVNGLFGTLPWFVWLNEFYDKKPALQKIKLETVIKRVKRAKASLLDEGWRSLGLDWEKLARIPCELLSYLQLCRAPRQKLVDYSACSALLGRAQGLDPAEAEREDCRQLRELLAPFQQWARP